MEEEKVLAPEVEEGDVEIKEAEKEEESLADSVRIVSPGRLVAKRFFRSRLSMVGLVTLIVLFAFSFMGPWFSPWEETKPDFTVPDEIRETYVTSNYYEVIEAETLFVNGKIGENSTKPGVTYDASTKIGTYKITVGEEVEDAYFVVETGASGAIYRSNPEGEALQFKCVEYTWDHKAYNVFGKIDAKHWLGTDDKGMDVFTRLMFGGRISLTLGFVVVILETILGVLFGGLAGYFGKWVDQIIMRIVDIINCIPQFPILLIMSAILDSMDIEEKLRIYYLMTTLTLLGWSGIARVVRGQILTLREQEYMVAAEALGLSVPRKIFRHLLPNVMPQLIVQMTLGLGGIILTESTLSYLGIGIAPPAAAWGTMISAAQRPEILQNYPNLWVPAGVLIVLAVLAFNFVGDGLRDAFDPKASR